MSARTRHQPVLKLVFVISFLLTSIGCQNGATEKAGPKQDPATKNGGLSDEQLSSHVSTLLSLIDQRLEMMSDVAKWKWNEKRPVEDLQREGRLLDRMIEEGSELDLNTDFVRDFFAAQIAASKMLQSDYFVTWEESKQPPFDYVRSLTEDLRPKITALSEQILKELKVLEADVGTDRMERLIRENAANIVDGPHISEAVRDTAIAPLLQPAATSAQ